MVWRPVGAFSKFPERRAAAIFPAVQQAVQAPGPVHMLFLRGSIYSIHKIRSENQNKSTENTEAEEIENIDQDKPQTYR